MPSCTGHDRTAVQLPMCHKCSHICCHHTLATGLPELLQCLEG